MQATAVSSTKTVSDLSYDLMTSGYTTTGSANIVLNYAKTMTDSTMGYVSILDRVTLDNVCHTLTGMIGDSCRIPRGMNGIIFQRDKAGRYPALWGHSLNTGKPFYTNAPQEHPAAIGVPSHHVTIVRFLSVPVVMGENVLGQISLANAPRNYTDADLDKVSNVAMVFAHALHRLSLDGRTSQPVSRQCGEQEDNGGRDGNGALPPDLQDTIAKNIRRLASPYIDRLMQTELSGNQLFLLEKLQENLEGAGSSLLLRTRLMNVSFTPQEFQIAILIRSGLQSKEIAGQLGVSTNAVNFHRKNIRKKLSISNKQVNLQTYLTSLEDW